MSPSLGWIQAFLCAADHLDYKRAAEDLGVSANSAKQRVRELEIWLHKILILDDPIELNEIDGLLFLPIALGVLQSFEAACPDCKGASVGPYATRRAKKISKIRLNDLERFLSVADAGSYKGAASILGCDVTTVQRSIQALEDVTDKQLLLGRSSLTLTGDGEAFKDTAAYIAQSLNDFRAVIPVDYDPSRAAIERLYKETKIQRSYLHSVVSLISRTGKKQRGRVRSDDVVNSLNVFSRLHDGLIKEFGPFDQISGKDIVIDSPESAMSNTTDGNVSE